MKEAVQSEGAPRPARARPVEKIEGGDVIVRLWLLGAERERLTLQEYL